MPAMTAAGRPAMVLRRSRAGAVDVHTASGTDRATRRPLARSWDGQPGSAARST